MRYTGVIISVIIAAAVLLAAYAVGLLIRQGRIENQQTGPQTVAAPNETAEPGAMIEDRMPGPPRTRRDADVDRSQVKQARAEQLERKSNLTEEEKEEFRQRIRSRFTRSRRFQNLSEAEREKMLQKWQNMSDEEKRAFLEQIQARVRTQPRRDVQATSDTTTEDRAASDPNVEETGSEPNEADQG